MNVPCNTQNTLKRAGKKYVFCFLSIIISCTQVHLLTVKSKHWGNSLAVGYSGRIWYTILPQVGEVVWGGQHYAVYLRPCPDLCGHRGTHQDPSRYADNKAADLHVHHHSPVTHGCLQVESLHGEKFNPTAPGHQLWGPAGNTPPEGQTWFVYIITCFALNFDSTVLWWGHVVCC